MFGAFMDLASKIPDYMHAEEMQEDVQQNNAVQSNLGREFSRDEAEKARQFNSAEAVAQRDWTQMMSSTAYQRTVGDLQRAGLNPMLAYQHGSTSSGTGSSATGAAATAPPGGSGGSGHAGRSSNFAAGMQSASNIQVNDALIERTQAETKKIAAEEGEIRERTPTHAASIDVMRQNIKESTERIHKIIQETTTSAHSAANLEQQTTNLREIVPQIRATVQQLQAQTKQTGALTGKTLEETSEIRQRIAAQLPKLEAALKDLEAQAKRTEMPAREQTEMVNRSFTGSLGAVLRSLNPLNNFLR